MLKIGLTGGIGSGKTTVAKIFEVLGIPVYYADLAARDLMNSNPDLVIKIKGVFGEDAYKNGVLDREYVGKLVFGNPEKLTQLNAIVHPATKLDAEQWMQKQKTPYAIKEAALIFEAGLEKYFDYIIGVAAPESLRLQRVMQRDHTTSENVMQRMEQQLDEGEKMDRCDFVVVNNGTEALLPQVMAIHETLKSKAGMAV